LHFYRQSVGVWLGLGILGLGNGKGFRVRLEYRIRFRNQRYAMVNSGGQVRGRGANAMWGGQMLYIPEPSVAAAAAAALDAVGQV